MEFKEILHDRYGLTTEACNLLTAFAERIDYDRRALILAEGQRDEHLYFVEQGAVRTYAMHDERCVILSFAFEGDAASLIPASEGCISRYQIETIEPSTVVRLPRAELERLYATHTELANWGRRIAEQRLKLYEEYFGDYAWMDKSKQYRYLLREYPQLLLRIPLKDLAAYLYVTPQTLSRIRAEMVRN